MNWDWRVILIIGMLIGACIWAAMLLLLQLFL